MSFERDLRCDFLMENASQKSRRLAFALIADINC